MPHFQVHVKYNICLKVSIKYKYKYSSSLYLLHLSTSPTVLDPNPAFMILMPLLWLPLMVVLLVIYHAIFQLHVVLIWKGGTIVCQVTGRRCRFYDLVQGGLEIPCSYTFS